MPAKQVSRKEFLAGAGALVIGLSLGPALFDPTRGNHTALADSTSLDIDTWLVINGDSTATIYSDKVELGTGIQTALSQIAAEELRLDLSSIRFVQGDTAQTSVISAWDIGVTAGSQTLQKAGPALRQAAATAYQWLFQQASAQLKVDVHALRAGHGSIGIGANQNRTRTYGQIIGSQTTQLTSTSDVPLRDPGTYTLVGTPVPRVDLPDKFTGRFEYMHDVRVPGMLHGRVIRPAGRNASFASYDDSQAQSIPGYVATVRRGNFVGVVARTEWAAIQAAKKVTVTWNAGPDLPAQSDLNSTLRTTPNQTTTALPLGAGDVPTALASAASVLAATYFSPFNMHATVGPSCGVADVERDSSGNVTQITVWSGTQGPFPLRSAVAQMLGVDAGTVRVIYAEAAGCYGHNGADDAAADAALMSWLAGQPVRVQWMRPDEHNWEPLGPAMVHDLKGGLDPSGNVVAWQHELWTPTHSTRPSNLAGNLWAGQETGFSTSPKVSTVNSGGRNAPINYGFPNVATIAHGVPSFSVANGAMTYSLLRSSSMRGLGGLSNTFANESFVDEMAHLAGVDPLAFRLRYISDPRGVAVLQAMAQQANWSGPFSSTRNGLPAGRGVSYLQYENALAYVAAYAEVVVDPLSGAVHVSRVVIAHDCGQIINPDGLRNQIEGNVIQGASRALVEEVQFNAQGVTNNSWQNSFNPGGYRILHFDEVPDSIEIVLVDQPNLPPLGAGEPVTEVMASLIGNAVFDAVGARLRTMPFTPSRVLEAIGGS